MLFGAKETCLKDKKKKKKNGTKYNKYFFLQEIILPLNCNQIYFSCQKKKKKKKKKNSVMH